MIDKTSERLDELQIVESRLMREKYRAENNLKDVRRQILEIRCPWKVGDVLVETEHNVYSWFHTGTEFVVLRIDNNGSIGSSGYRLWIRRTKKDGQPVTYARPRYIEQDAKLKLVRHITIERKDEE